MTMSFHFFNVTPHAGAPGARVTSIDLANLTDDVWAELYRVFLEYGVLVFPEQHLDEEGQGRFASRFGATEKLAPRQQGPNVQISNKRRDGTLAQPDDMQYQVLKGNEGWHTDSTYMPLASKVAMLSALEIPPEAGETEFADMRAAYDALNPALQIRLESLQAYHSLYYSQEKAGYTHTTDNIYGLHDKGAPLRDVIKVHPETGRKSIYTGRHAHDVPGMPRAESDALLDQLMEEACQPPRVYTHHWTVGDTVVWDNRCMMHRARPYNKDHPRVLRGTRISGDLESEQAECYPDPRANAFVPSQTNTSSLVT
ncbi:MAG: TauD/TfdA family dioxygenase [Pseudomonadota bacterium]